MDNIYHVTYTYIKIKIIGTFILSKIYVRDKMLNDFFFLLNADLKQASVFDFLYFNLYKFKLPMIVLGISILSNPSVYLNSWANIMCACWLYRPVYIVIYYSFIWNRKLDLYSSE